MSKEKITWHNGEFSWSFKDCRVKFARLMVQSIKARPFIQFLACKTVERIRGLHCTRPFHRHKSNRLVSNISYHAICQPVDQLDEGQETEAEAESHETSELKVHSC